MKTIIHDAWCVVNKYGRPILCTMSKTKKEALGIARDWEWYLEDGHRAVRVEVVVKK